MSEPEDPTPTDAPSEGQEPDEPDTPVDNPDDANPPDEDDTDVEKLRAQIARLRRENAKARTDAKQRAAEEAAAQARQEAEAEKAAEVEALKSEYGAKFNEVARLLGLVKDDEPVTPEKLVEQANAKAEEAEKARKARDAEYLDLLREVAVQDAAAAHEADASKLLDSRTFMRQIEAIDPSDRSAFRVAVMSAVETAIGENASLKAARAPKPPTASGSTTVAGSPTKDLESMSVEELMEAKIHRRGF